MKVHVKCYRWLHEVSIVCPCNEVTVGLWIKEKNWYNYIGTFQTREIKLPMQCVAATQWTLRKWTFQNVQDENTLNTHTTGPSGPEGLRGYTLNTHATGLSGPGGLRAAAGLPRYFIFKFVLKCPKLPWKMPRFWSWMGHSLQSQISSDCNVPTVVSGDKGGGVTLPDD